MKKFLMSLAVLFVAITALVIPQKVDAATLKRPVITAASRLDDGTVRLAWKTVKNAEKFYVYRKTPEEEEFVLIGKTKATKLRFLDKTAQAGVTYEYTISATKGKDEEFIESKKSKVLSVVDMGAPVVSAIKYDKWGDNAVKWSKVDNATGYIVYKSKKKGELGKKYLTTTDAKVLKCKDTLDELPDTRVYYTVKAYYVNEDGVTVYSRLSNTRSIKALYRIMGKSRCTADQLAAYYHMRERTEKDVMYPAEYLGPGGAPTVEDFAQIIMEECAAEGVRAEVLFGQAMIETGLLLYRHTSVSPNSYNFAGMGATGAADADILGFPDIRTGIRCQVQHLKAYGTKDPLVNPLVDDRFKYVPRGCAVYVRWLGIPENPIGRGWAASPDYPYGDLIVNNYVKKILAM